MGKTMISLKGVCKTFSTKGGNVDALKDINLDINAGEIFGIIGFSGAGKSTLVRCINMLEKPDSGSVTVDGQCLTDMNESGIRNARRSIGMIFQLFNLMRSRTVFDNVEFPLKYRGIPKAERHERVNRLLKIVGLDSRAKAYPAMLSGGQKQRVAIARALASNPKLLLCDEATSALDPQTTQEILDLLKQLNKDLGITIVVITHEMAVVKQICSSVAVMEDGCVVEKGDIYSVFSNPQQPITKRFIATTDGMAQAEKAILANPAPYLTGKNSRIIKLCYSDSSTGHAIVSRLSKDYNIDISIVYGNIDTLDNKPLGRMITVFSGENENIDSALKALVEYHVTAEVL